MRWNPSKKKVHEQTQFYVKKVQRRNESDRRVWSLTPSCSRSVYISAWTLTLPLLLRTGKRLVQRVRQAYPIAAGRSSTRRAGCPQSTSGEWEFRRTCFSIMGEGGCLSRGPEMVRPSIPPLTPPRTIMWRRMEIRTERWRPRLRSMLRCP